MNDKKGVLRKEFTYNRRKKDGVEGPPQAPPEEGMYKLGVVGGLLLVACTRSLDGGDVQIECGIVSLLVVLDCLFGRCGCAGGDLIWGVGIMERGRNRDQSSMFNARNSEG